VQNQIPKVPLLVFKSVRSIYKSFNIRFKTTKSSSKSSNIKLKSTILEPDMGTLGTIFFTSETPILDFIKGVSSLCDVANKL
jgi:hypothetical protein